MSTLTIFKRELGSYFAQPTAYAIIVIFLMLAMGLAFTFGSFIKAGDASLEWSFFFWHPWIFMLLAPAVGMRLWADEQRNGTIELLGTFPVSTRSAIIGKFLAAATVWLVALACTFPIVITVNYLGAPDNGVILSGYIGSFLVCCSFVAVTMLVSACTRDQVVCLIVSVFVCFLAVVIGYDPVARALDSFATPPAADVMSATGVWAQLVRLWYQGVAQVVEVATSFGVWNHFASLNRGLFRLQDLVWFGSIILVSLLGTSAILSAKRS